MKKIIFKRIGMKNFCSYTENELVIKPNSLTVIYGPNGAGKTTNFECILYTLHGVTSKGGHSDDVVNNRYGKDCHTFVEFDIINEEDKITEYRVDRYSKDRKLGNTVTITKDGQLWKKGQKEVKPIIDTLVMSKDLLLNTLYFPQKVSTFFTDLTDAQQKDIFRKVLLLDDYVLYNKESGTIVKEIDSELDIFKNDVNTTNGMVSATKCHLENTMKEKEQFYIDKKDRVSRLRKSKDSVLKELDSIDILLDQFSKKGLDEILQGLIKRNTEVEKDISSISAEKESIILQIESAVKSKESEFSSQYQKRVSGIKQEYQTKIDSVTNSRDSECSDIREKKSVKVSEISECNTVLSSANTTLAFRIESRKELSNALDSDFSECPMCKQEITEKSKENIRNRLFECNDEIDKTNQEKLVIEEKISQLKLELKEIENKLEKVKLHYDSKIQSLKDERDSIVSTTREKYDTAVEKLKDSRQLEIDKAIDKISVREQDLSSELSNLRDEKLKIDTDIKERKKVEDDRKELLVKSKQSEIDLRKEEESEFDDTRIKNLESDISKLNIKIGEMQQRLFNHNKRKNIIEFWKEAFSSSGIPSMLIDESIPFMNKRITDYLNIVSTGRYTISFDTLSETKGGEIRDKISIHVLDSHSLANSRVQLSGGQTRLIDIATILTLRDLQSMTQNVDINLLLFDEIFDSLDDENITNVSYLLTQLSKNKSIYIISHRLIEDDSLRPDETIHIYN